MDPKLLQSAIKEKLTELSASVVDDVLPEYVLVLVGNHKTQSQVASDLDAFLGKKNAIEFAQWLWDTMNASANKKEKAKDNEKAAKTRAKSDDRTDRSGRTSTRGQDPGRESSRYRSEVRESDRSQSPARSVFQSVITVPEPVKPRAVEDPAPSRLLLSAVQDAYKSSSRQDVHMTDESYEDEPRQRASKTHYKSTRQPRNDTPVTFTVTLDGAANIPHKPFVEDDAEVDDNYNSAPRRSSKRKEPSIDSSLDEIVAERRKSSRKQKCQFWPKCKRGLDCEYHHPTITCSSFPHCTFGENCLFIHPVLKCRFGSGCTAVECQFNHPPPAVGPPCRNGFSCDNTGCAFDHPPEACRFANNCARIDCRFAHGTHCRFGAACTTPMCSFAHHRPKPACTIKNCSDPSCKFQHTDMALTVDLLSATLPRTP